MDNIIVETNRLKKYFPVYGGVFKKRVSDVKAVDGVDLKIKKGECLGLVGESGCGKTTLGKTLIRLIRPTQGNIFFEVPEEVKRKIQNLCSSNSYSPELDRLRRNYDLATFQGKRLKQIRKKAQIVFQDPSSSLNPRMLIRNIVGEPLKIHQVTKHREKRVLALLNLVGLTEDHLFRYPHEFSGGQRQRIAIARALATNPDFVVLDEPTSALDVSVQAQTLNLLKELQEEFNLTYLFITHHLMVVKYMAARIAVMYLGKIIELAPTESIFSETKHPYTKALISAIPEPEIGRKKERIILTGDVPSPVDPPSGCRFHPRCPYVTDRCKKEEPSLRKIGNEHWVGCHLAEKLTHGASIL